MKTNMLRVFTAALFLAVAGTIGGANIATQALGQSPALKAQAEDKFDGAKLYKEAFEKIRDQAFKLRDKDLRDKFIKEWENKYDGDAKLDTRKGTTEAITLMLRSVGQRFDSFQDDEGTQGLKDQQDATLVGIGARIGRPGLAEAMKKLPKDANIDDIKNTAKVTKDMPMIIDEPMEGGPAEKVGLKSGDEILKVNGKSVYGQQSDEVISQIRGKEKTDVEITVGRKDDKGKVNEMTFKVTRERVTVKVVQYKDLGNGTSYVKLSDFMSKNAVSEMEAALTKAAKGKALILDLRGNGGGRLDYCLQIAAQLLPKGKLMDMHRRVGDDTMTVTFELKANAMKVSQKFQGVTATINQPREDCIIPEDMPIIVLVDEHSASASEILSGLLQANGRAVIVGKTTLGKGVGQNVVPLSFDSTLLITNFEFEPGGVAIDGKGVVPTRVVDRAQTGTTDAQLDAAKDEVRKALEKKGN